MTELKGLFYLSGSKYQSFSDVRTAERERAPQAADTLRIQPFLLSGHWVITERKDWGECEKGNTVLTSEEKSNRLKHGKRESIVEDLTIAPKYHHHPGAPHKQKIKHTQEIQ